MNKYATTTNIDAQFITAAKNNDMIKIMVLLSKGANVSKNDDAALRWSANAGYIEMVKILLENDANVHTDNDQALRLSAKYGHTKVVKQLLKHGANNKEILINLHNSFNKDLANVLLPHCSTNQKCTK